ncbi:SGNH/GDSL hydrolase family protein [Paenibacillus sp. GCM10027626]|uniref:SGNH/GDSL hydrolase family protein n=1 Tax=Paenibacillus sp. GCM10027626 TaxID=3273411 RepID=UPI0036266BC1
MLNTMNKLDSGGHALIVCIGDSITEQNYHLHGKLNYVGQLTERLMTRYNRRTMVVNAGKSGDTTGGILARLTRDALRFQPDLVTVMIGMNDSAGERMPLGEFRENLEQIVNRIREAGSEALLLTQNMLDYQIREEAVETRRLYPRYADAVREAASACSVPLCDVYRRWEEATGGQTNAHLMLMHDSIHPGEQGHVLIYEALCGTLNISE